MFSGNHIIQRISPKRVFIEQFVVLLLCRLCRVEVTYKDDKTVWIKLALVGELSTENRSSVAEKVMFCKAVSYFYKTISNTTNTNTTTAAAVSSSGDDPPSLLTDDTFVY